MASDLARKLVAVLVLVVAAFVLFKVVIGFVAAIAWIVVAVVAVMAVIWALLLLMERPCATPPARGCQEAAGAGFSSSHRPG